MLNIEQLLGIEITKGNPLIIYHPVHGTEIYFKNSWGDEEWRDYDSSGNLIHLKNSDGLEQWRDYNSSGNLIHLKNSDGFEQWRDYDSLGNLIHLKNSDGDEVWREWDSSGNLVYYKVNDEVYLDNRKKSLTKSEIAEKLGISVEDVENAQ